MNRMRIAVIGAAGTVGSTLVRHLRELENVDVVATCRNKISAGILNYLVPDCDIRIGSVSEKDNELNRILDDCDVIINCALAEGGGPKGAYQLNGQIIDGILSSRNLKLLIHFSSASVYGDFITDSKKSTFSRPKPDNEYGRSKYYVEQYAHKRCLSKNIKHYIIRLGHVIGAGTDRSKELISFSKSPQFRLPYNGSLPSNTIHVDRLALLIKSLVCSTSVPDGIYNAAEKDQTWRSVFDWHTSCIGLPPVKPLDLSSSNKMTSFYARQSVINDTLNWFKSLPWNSLIRSPKIFDVALRVLKKSPNQLITYFSNLSRGSGAFRQISALSDNKFGLLNPVYLSKSMPGQYLSFPDEAYSSQQFTEKICNDLKKWFELYDIPGILSR